MRDEIRAILDKHLKPTTYNHLRSVEGNSTKALEDALVSYCDEIYYSEMLERGVEEYLALRYADDPVEAFNLFIKAWVPERYHGYLLDNDENDGQFVRDHIERNRPERAFTDDHGRRWEWCGGVEGTWAWRITDGRASR